MSILRVERRARFSVIDQRTLRDKRLSFRALGLLVHLLSHHDGWVISMASLAGLRSEGRDALRTAASELREAGYMTQSREQNNRGQWVTITTVREVSDASPQVAPETGFQASDTRALVNRPSGEPTDGFPGAQRNTKDEDNPLPPYGLSWVDEEFESKRGWTATNPRCKNDACVNGWVETEKGLVPCETCNVRKAS